MESQDSFRSEDAEVWFSERTSAKPLQGKWRRMREMLLHSTDIHQFEHVLLSVYFLDVE